jgi:predicted nucleic acid-binding protein
MSRSRGSEVKIANASVDLYLTGYVTSGAVFFTNAVDKSTATLGTYVDVDITGDLHLCRDVGDDMVLETALNGRATHIVSRDGDLVRSLDLMQQL